MNQRMFFSLFFIVFSALLSMPAMAQNTKPDTAIETVVVKKDPRFDELAAKQAEMNKRSLQTFAQKIKGWRIQASNTQNRDEANTVKAELLRKFPNEKTYLLYYSPNYRVRIGNFLTQKDAMPLRKMLEVLYPGKGIYIVQDVIEYLMPADEEEAGRN